MRSALIRNLGTALTVLTLPVMAAAQTVGAERVDEVRREASGHVGPLYFTPKLFLKELGVDSNVFNAAGEPKSDFTFTVATQRRRVGSGRAPGAVPGPRRHRPGLVRELRQRALDRSAVRRPRRSLHPPDHALRRGRLPQHPAAAELRSRRARAPRREQRLGRSGRAADAEVLGGGRRPHRRDALRRRRGVRRRPPPAHARSEDDRLQRRRPSPRDAAHDAGRPLREHRRRVPRSRRCAIPTASG